MTETNESEGRTLASPLERVFGYLLELFPLILIVLVPVAGGILTTLYILFRDGIFPGQSIGKRILKTQVINAKTGLPATYRESAIRNLPLAINFFLPIVPLFGHILGGVTGVVVFTVEAVALFTDKERRRWGDKVAGTIVIKLPG